MKRSLIYEKISQICNPEYQRMVILRNYSNGGIKEDTLGEVIEDEREHESNNGHNS